MLPRRRNPIAEWLRSIHYHSARREATRWSRTMDLVLFMSPAVAVLVAVLMHLSPLRIDDHVVARGHIERDPRAGGNQIVFEGSLRYGRGWGPIPVGTFESSRTERHGGWPLVSSVWRGPTQHRVRIFAEDNAQLRPAGPDDETLVNEIVESIGVGEAGVEATELLRAESGHRRRTVALLANMGLWWVACYFILGIAVQSARLIAWRIDIGRRKRLRRARALGQCPQCGYDTRASVWSERCPECGALLD